MTNENKDEIGKAFIIGIGRIGGLLLDISAGPCLRIDDQRWSMNTGRGNLILSEKTAQRLIEDGWVAITPEKLMDRDVLNLTEKGTGELIHFCLKRSLELSEIDPPSVPSVGESTPPVTVQSMAYDLAKEAFDQAYHSKRHMPPRPHLTVSDNHGAVSKDLYAYLEPKKDEPRGRHLARLFGVINAIAEASVCGLPLGEMPDVARWGAVMAAEAFERAPAQDWDMSEAGDE